MADKYVIHFCKNPECNNCWIDLDLTNAQTRPPQWKYCDECCRRYGYVNPSKPPQKELSEKQRATLEKNKFSKRKKTS